MKKLISLFIIAILFAGCSSSKEELFYETPYEFKFPDKKKDFLYKYSKYIEDKSIFIDPGHGGDDRRNKGPNGIVEADVNLRVSLYLKDFLRETGARVLMSRVDDDTVPLKKRPEMANNSDADIFISVHHNAPAKEKDNWTNYTSTYYHATENDYEYEPCERDLARYVQRDLSYAMRNSGGPGSFDGTYSDYSLYPGEGLYVLRVTEMPSILVECGFHTHRYGEKLLAIEEFNKIQAWGIFKGLCRYFAVGIPEIIPVDEKKNHRQDENKNYSFKILSEQKIDASSIKVFLNKEQIQNYTFNNKTGILAIPVEFVKTGEHELRIIAANINGNHSFPFRKKISAVKN